MTCRLGGSLPQMRGNWRRRRAEPAPVMQLLFVELPLAPVEDAGDDDEAANSGPGPRPAGRDIGADQPRA